MKRIYLLILLLTSLLSNAQNDTIYLYTDHIELENQIFNRTENGLKNGKWINFWIDNNEIEVVEASGENNHWHDDIYTIYRPLKVDEYIGKTYIKTSEMEIWRPKGDTIYNCVFDKIDNRVPKKFYHISTTGKYFNDLKVGKWIYYHNNGIVKKVIFYDNGIPSKGFSIFRPDNSKIIDVEKLSDDNWEVVKYSETGKEIERQKRNTAEMELLF